MLQQWLSRAVIRRALACVLMLYALWVTPRTPVEGQAASSISSGSITVSVTATGAYTITSQMPAWAFGGRIGAPLTGITTAVGSDAVGSYQDISFSYQDQSGAARGGDIRVYQSLPIVEFIDTHLSAGTNVAPFPKLATYPSGLYHMTYQYTYAQHTFSEFGHDGPWLFFDAQANTFLLSAASDFLITSTTKASSGTISTGITTAISALPQGFTHSTLLVIEPGINATLQTWGHALTAMQGKTRPPSDADVTLRTLGYWTDHGGTYYYSYDPALGYAGTLLAVRDSFRQQGIPLGYMELDSWWYPKGSADTWSAHKGGIYTYSADPTLFPNGLASFQQQLGLPLVVHAKFIDSSSPYYQQYTISNDYATDPNYWNSIASYLQGAGVISYEQDWLDTKHLPLTNLSDPQAFTTNMATALAAHGITALYSTQLPRFFLQSSLYNNLTAARVSPDVFQTSHWDTFLYTSHLAASVGIWPWSDVFMSTQTDNLLLSTLSAGMVGVGDAVGAESAQNLFQTIRADGVIVKPDAPIVPLDSVYVQDAQLLGDPMVAVTYTDFGAGMRAAYVFSYARGANTAAAFTPASLGFSGSVYIYNYFTHAGVIVPAGGSYTDTVSTGSYYLVVPIGPSGIAFLGDVGKFVSLGKKRIAQLSDTGTLQATVTFAAGETALTMHGYSPAAPQVTASDGTVGSTTYDSASGQFSVVVSPCVDGSATITVAHT